MEFTGSYAIPAPPETVWAALNDPATLKSCIPGCESLARDGEHRFLATATLRIGPVKATFKSVIEQSELEPPRRCVLRGEGQGGVAGFARGAAEVVLGRNGEATVLTYTAQATIGGKLAQIGQRLIDSAARQVADEFFARFSAEVSAPDTMTPAPERPVGEMPDQPPLIQDRTSREGLAPEIWVIGLIAIVIILLALFGTVL
jgi:hypothetical protein